ncbi:MAG: hypothetical protein FWH12_00205 [Treponema sp.]|nr:hypothetical protein [Treponema sp.]
MKTLSKLSILTAIIAIYVLVFTACSNPAGGGNRDINGDDDNISLDLYAKAPPILDSDTPIASFAANDIDAAVAYVVDADNPDGEYTLLLHQGLTNTAQLNLNRANRELTIIGLDGEITIQKNSIASQNLFNISNGARLIIGENITLQGIETGSTALVNVAGTGSYFTMLEGSKITGHTINSSSHGAAVTIGQDGHFFMSGGEINDNHNTVDDSIASGGVYVIGTFTMTGGSMTGNTMDTNTPMDIVFNPSGNDAALTRSSNNGGTIGASYPDSFAGN